MVINICFKFDKQVRLIEDGQSRAGKELCKYGGNWGALGDPMIRLGGHWPTKTVKGDGHKSIANKQCDPCLQWEGNPHLGKVRMEVSMSNIVKESLNVAGKDRINLLFLPSGLDIHDQAGTGISNGRVLSPSKLVVREEAFGISEVLELLGYQLL